MSSGYVWLWARSVAMSCGSSVPLLCSVLEPGYWLESFSAWQRNALLPNGRTAARSVLLCSWVLRFCWRRLGELLVLYQHIARPESIPCRHYGTNETAALGMVN